MTNSRFGGTLVEGGGECHGEVQQGDGEGGTDDLPARLDGGEVHADYVGFWVGTF
jgi:hypothetical protein